MTAIAIACTILFEIAILVAVWYNGRNYGRTKTNAETTQVGADVAAEHTKQLEVVREKQNEAAQEKDASEAKAVGSDSKSALDYVVRSYANRGSQGSGPR
jgi:hypothetical protein